MESNQTSRIRALIERLSRLSETEDWTGDINPAQMGALRYLARANRFSRAPSQVASFAGSTRGTMSQTLRALERKGLVTEARSERDKRSIVYQVTESGRALALAGKAIDASFAGLSESEAQILEELLSRVLKNVIAARGGRSFGMCRHCRHHEKRWVGGYCRLLAVELAEVETTQICYEHEVAQ